MMFTLEGGNALNYIIPKCNQYILNDDVDIEKC